MHSDEVEFVEDPLEESNVDLGVGTGFVAVVVVNDSTELVEAAPAVLALVVILGLGDK